MEHTRLHDRIEAERAFAALLLQFLQPFFSSRPAGRESIASGPEETDDSDPETTTARPLVPE
jgi:hypothetical protein